MKVYAAPAHIKLVPDYNNYDRNKEQKKEDKYKADIKAWAESKGYTGPRTGETVKFGVADGYAEYMYACGPGGAKAFLIHLEICDGYQYRDVEFLPKKEILTRMDFDRKMEAAFAAKRKK